MLIEIRVIRWTSYIQRRIVAGTQPRVCYIHEINLVRDHKIITYKYLLVKDFMLGRGVIYRMTLKLIIV